MATVVARAGASSADELRGWCAARLAGYKVPKAFEFVGDAAAHARRASCCAGSCA